MYIHYNRVHEPTTVIPVEVMVEELTYLIDHINLLTV